LTSDIGTPPEQIRRELLAAVQAWNRDPRPQLKTLTEINAVKTRITAGPTTPEKPWDRLAAELDPRLLHQADWPATAELSKPATTTATTWPPRSGPS